MLAFAMCLSVVACAKDDGDTGSTNKKETTESVESSELTDGGSADSEVSAEIEVTETSAETDETKEPIYLIGYEVAYTETIAYTETNGNFDIYGFNEDGERLIIVSCEENGAVYRYRVHDYNDYSENGDIGYTDRYYDENSCLSQVTKKDSSAFTIYSITYSYDDSHNYKGGSIYIGDPVPLLSYTIENGEITVNKFLGFSWDENGERVESWEYHKLDVQCFIDCMDEYYDIEYMEKFKEKLSDKGMTVEEYAESILELIKEEPGKAPLV